MGKQVPPVTHDAQEKQVTQAVYQETDQRDHLKYMATLGFEKNDHNTRKGDAVFSKKTVENAHDVSSQYKMPKVDFEQYDLSELRDFAQTVDVFDRPLKSDSIYDGLRYIGTFINTYLIYEKEEKLYLIDQHAAHEKILYEQLMA